MKVLMFGWEFPPHISGGLGTACLGLTKALSGFQDVKLTFVVPKVWGDEDHSKITLIGADQVPVICKQIQFADYESKVTYYELNSGLVPYLGTSEFDELNSENVLGKDRLVEVQPDGKFSFMGDYGPNLFQEIQNYALVAGVLASELDFDVIHVHDWMTFPAGITASRISGKPLVVHIHSTEFDRSGTQVNPAICTIEKEGLEVADQIISVSNFTRNRIIHNYHIQPEKIKAVYNAVEQVDPEEKSGWERDAARKTVTFLGRLTRQKGPGYFLDAANLVLQKMKDVRFVMAGKGDLREAMIRRVAELNISQYFDFPGFVQDSEISSLFRKSDVFVMPSVSEPFGIVALEAMQAGVPLVISKQSGVSEVLENALKVDYWDTHKMADAISSLLINPEIAGKLIKNGKLEVDKLTWTVSASKVRELYKRLIDERSIPM